MLSRSLSLNSLVFESVDIVSFSSEFIFIVILSEQRELIKRLLQYLSQLGADMVSYLDCRLSNVRTSLMRLVDKRQLASITLSLNHFNELLAGFLDMREPITIFQMFPKLRAGGHLGRP